MNDLEEVVNGLTETGEGWEASYLPEGFIQNYSGPERVEGSRLSLVWVDKQTMGEISLDLIKEGFDPMERTVFTLLGPGTYPASTIGNEEIRGNLAVRLETWKGQGEGAQTVFQWMETPTVMARLIIQGSGINPDLVVNALRAVDQSTWEAILKAAITTNDLNSTATTVGPADNSIANLNSP